MIILGVEGTWAPEPWGLLGEIVSRVSLPIERIQYPEQYGDAFSYNESVTVGKSVLRKKILSISEPYIVVCYSQGAHIAGDVLLEFRSDTSFKAAYLIADPKRSSRDILVGSDPGGTGIFGPRPVGPKALHFAAKGDIISANTNGFISNVARYTLEKKKQGVKAWLRTFKSARTERVAGGKVISAFKEVHYYLKSKVHTSYGSYIVEDGLTVTEWIARDINKVVGLYA